MASNLNGKTDDFDDLSPQSKMCYVAHLLLAKDPIATFVLDQNLDSLPKQGNFLMRLFLGFPPKFSIDEISELIGLSRERVIELIDQHSRQLTHPTRFDSLHNLYEEAISNASKNQKND
jgi:hypothetical protein